MNEHTCSNKRRTAPLRHWLATVSIIGLVACQTQTASAPAQAPAVAPPAPSGGQLLQPAATSTPLILLKATPDKGPVGTPFVLSGQGLPASQNVTFFWATVDGGYDMKVTSETIEYNDRKFTDKRVPLGSARTDEQGKLSYTAVAPDDYGQSHSIFAAIEGKDVAQGGFTTQVEFSYLPAEGPVGTMITIQAKGIGSKAWESTWGVNYDNKYAGYISAVTTRGNATVKIRAAGPAGKHTIDIWHAGQTVPYLNWEQSPQSYIPVFHYAFTVTGDQGAPAPALEWPAAGKDVSISDMPAGATTANTDLAASNVRALLEPAGGPILSTANLKAGNLTPNSTVNLQWVTATGSRTSGSGWNITQRDLGQATVDGTGNLAKTLQIPDDLGGWHSLQIIQHEKEVAEAHFLVQPSLVDITPKVVKQGEMFQVHIKGVGWTELDNIYSVVYDNGYIGFACGFNSGGDVTLNLSASGVPGTHLVDLYPAVYQGHGKPPWLYDTPQLSFGQDHPSLGLGYRLPAFRLAIQVVE